MSPQDNTPYGIKSLERFGIGAACSSRAGLRSCCDINPGPKSHRPLSRNLDIVVWRHFMSPDVNVVSFTYSVPDKALGRKVARAVRWFLPCSLSQSPLPSISSISRAATGEGATRLSMPSPSSIPRGPPPVIELGEAKSPKTLDRRVSLTRILALHRRVESTPQSWVLITKPEEPLHDHTSYISAHVSFSLVVQYLFPIPVQLEQMSLRPCCPD